MASVNDRRWKIDRATGEKVRTGFTGSKPYQVRWREVPGGPHKYQHFERKIDAERFVVKVQHDLLSGTYVDPSAGRVTFESYAETWRDQKARTRHRAATAEHAEVTLRRHVYPVLGPLPMARIRRSDVQALVLGMADTLAPSTVETVYRHVAAIFRSAVRDRVIPSTPCDGIELPRRQDRGELVPLETADVLAVREAMPDRWQALVTAGAGTGLRQGELLGLTVDRVDFLRRTVRVDRQLVTVRDGSSYVVRFAPPKTDKSVRTVPLPQTVADELAAHLARYGSGTDGLIFTTDDGGMIRRQRISEAWRRATTASKLPKTVRFHDLRHFYASVLINAGASVKVVQSRLGHASPVETLETYAHLWPDDEDRTRQAVDDVLGGYPASTQPVPKTAANGGNGR